MANRRNSRLSILLEFILDATLLLLFMAQAFIGSCLLFYGYLPLPTQLGNRMIAQKLPTGLLIQVESFRLQINGSIELSNIDLKAEGIEQSLFKADTSVVQLQWAFERPRLDSLIVSGGTLYIPSVYSPNGHHRKLLERIAFRLLPEDTTWNVDRFSALHDNIYLRGAFQIPATEASISEPDINQRLKSFYLRAAEFSKLTERFQYFETPTIAFSMNALDEKAQQVDLHISSRSLKHPEANAAQVQLHCSVQLNGLELTPLSVPRLNARYIELPRYEVTADDISAAMTTSEFNRLLIGEWPKIQLAARRISLKDFELDGPILEVDLAHFPSVEFLGATAGLNGATQLNGRINAELLEGKVSASGSVDLVKLAPAHIQEKLPLIKFGSRPYYDLNLTFAPSLKLARADLMAELKDLKLEGIHFDHINTHASYEDGIYAIEDLYVRRGQQWLDLKFSLNPESGDYRVTLYGTAVPYEYNTLLPSWWEAIFRDFDFSQSDYSLGDFIIYGNTRRKAADLYFGHAEAEQIRYKNVLIDTGALIVRGRGAYTELHNIKATSGQGWARGNITFTSKLDEIKGPASIRLDMEAQLTLEDASKLFGESIATIIQSFETEGLPKTKLKGAIFNSAYPEYAGKSFFDLSVDSPLPLSYKKVPLESLSFDLYGRSEVTYLRNMKLGYAGGRGRAKIDIFTPSAASSSMRYQFELIGAEASLALRNLPEFNEFEDSLQTTEQTDEAEPSKTGGLADLTLHGEGPVDSPIQHTGFGHFEIRNDRLGTIQLLGPLSKFLQNTQLNFTSFNLDQMRGQFHYVNEDIHFDLLRIDGDRTQIFAPGRLRLTDQSIDMRVSVSLFGNAGNPDSQLRKLGDLLAKPLPNLLQFELYGTINDQKFRSLYDPRNYIPRF
jgi:hypothetical protein